MEAYCVKCKQKVEIQNPQNTEFSVRGGIRHAKKGTCPYCGTKVFRIVKG